MRLADDGPRTTKRLHRPPETRDECEHDEPKHTQTRPRAPPTSPSNYLPLSVAPNSRIPTSTPPARPPPTDHPKPKPATNSNTTNAHTLKLPTALHGPESSNSNVCTARPKPATSARPPENISHQPEPESLFTGGCAPSPSSRPSPSPSLGRGCASRNAPPPPPPPMPDDK
ncbi:hypothetical protein B0H15DRAFT_510746 [Mycena belliarum]|uniref:Uncharacterized protein n=1 Tax=Mycena belliarum TaxID=1033014 RepID=A0AAD6XSJ2_9AGAR|nr:hypothetical protein B0H15DRAFT_510746 [Mycena belliae]